MSEIEELKQELEKLKNEIGAGVKTFMGIVEDIKDPDNEGKAKVRVIDTMTPSKTELPTEDLPFAPISKPAGSSGGIGQNSTVSVGQMVELIATNAAESAFKIIRNVDAIFDDETGDKAFGNVAEGEDNKIKKEKTPSIGTGDVLKLAGTIYAVIQSQLVKSSSAGTGAVEEEITFAWPSPFEIIVNDIDWSLDESKYVSRFGANLGSILDYIKITDDGGQTLISPPKDSLIITLIDEASGAQVPGNIVGKNLDGEEQYVTYENNNLHIPENVPVLETGYYTIQFKVEKNGVINPGDTVEEFGTIKINVIDLPLSTRNSVARTEISIPPTNAAAPNINISEPPSTADKAQSWYNRVDQGIDNSVIIENDGTPGNRRYCISHLADKDDPYTLSRFEMKSDGGIIQKAGGDMYLLSEKSLKQKIKGMVEQEIDQYLNIQAQAIFMKAPKGFRLEGDIEIVGNITQTGGITSTEDHVAGTISLQGHVHPGDGDDSTNSINTGTPIA